MEFILIIVGMAMLPMEIIIGWKYGWVEAVRLTGTATIRS